MSYSIPHIYEQATLAAVAGTASVAIIPAPGVGFAIRLTGGHFGIGRAAGARMDFSLTSGIFGLRLGSLFADAASSTSPIVIPFPGIQLPENTALNFNVVSTAATGSGLCTVFYFIDDVS